MVSHVVEFIGGPWDGVVQQIPDDVPPPRIDVALFGPLPLTAEDTPPAHAPTMRTAIYRRIAHTRFADPYGYRYEGEE